MIPATLKERFTSDWRKTDWPRTILLIGLIFAIYAALWQYFMPQVRTITTKEFKRVAEIRTVRDVKRVYVTCPEQGLVALDKKEIAGELDMPWLSDPAAPAPVEGDATTLHPTATADLPESRNGYQVVTVVNTDTGVTIPVVQEKEAPWFRLENTGTVGLWYGLDIHLQQIAQGELTWKFLRIKDVHLGLKADGTTDGSGHALAGIIYEW
jgi:hypothetical protein